MTARPLWAGRFEREPASAAWALVRSLDVDARLAPYDLRQSEAHATALAEAGILEPAELERIRSALVDIAAELEAGRFAFAEADEDIHTAIERALTERLGDTGARIHAGRSRNDQVVADLRLFLLDACAGLRRGVRRLVAALLDRAAAHDDVLMPGYTHLQRAQPVLLAHHLLAHAWALTRDDERLARAAVSADRSPLGSGALAGTTLPLGYDTLAERLGFTRRAENSIDAVSDRDFALEFLGAGAILGVHLSRLAEELVLWSTAEFGFARLDQAYATGSSIMPQKRNPDAAELVRAKAGRLIGNFVTLATVLKALPLAYDRDLQEDKEPVFDTADTLDVALGALAGAVETLTFDTARLEASASDPAMLATDVAEHLAARGVPFRQAHEAVARLVTDAESSGRGLSEVVAAAWPAGAPRMRGVADAGPGDLPELSSRAAVERRAAPGATSPRSVAAQAASLRAWLASPLPGPGGTP